MTSTPLSILLLAIHDIVALDGDNTALVQHLTQVASNVANADFVAKHPEALQQTKTEEPAVTVPEGVTVQ